MTDTIPVISHTESDTGTQHVEATHVLHASIDDVWRLITDIETFSSYMDNVVSVAVLEHTPEGRVASWTVSVRGSLLQWTERGVLDVTRREVRFEQLDGDLAMFEGWWRLHEDAPDRVSVQFALTFEIGVPLLARMLNPMAKSALQESAEKMLGELRKRLRETAT